MVQVSVVEEANRLREIAHAGPIGKRHSSFELYDLLQKCMALAIRCRDPREFEALENAIREQPSEGKGRWVLRTSDEYLLVCRYVFPRSGHGKGELSNASRYASCLRQAAQRQIRSSELAAWLRENGGINALFLRRPLKRRSVCTKVLHLTESIEVPKDREFTLTLRRTPENTFEVIRHE
jgi:hypothetical protein